MSSGIKIFTSISDALNAGYQVYDRSADGYLVRTRTNQGWALAHVVLTNTFSPSSRRLP